MHHLNILNRAKGAGRVASPPWRSVARLFQGVYGYLQIRGTQSTRVQ